jgi:hypothetical protein
MNKDVKSLVDALKNDGRLLDSNNKMKMKELELVFKYGNIDTEISSEAVAVLRNDGFITIAKGDATHSPIQRKIKDFINSVPKLLFEKREAKLKITEEEAQLIREEKEGFGYDNALNEFIVPKCNNDNISHKREVARVKAQQKELESN